MNISWDIVLYICAAALVHFLIYCYFTKKPPKSIFGKHVVVTGGSSGIGLMISIECAKRGASVTIIARNVNMLEKAVKLLELNRQNSQQRFEYKSLDISQSYNNVSESLLEVEQSQGEIYMLVNCAGMAICGVFEDISVDDAKLLMDVNYFGTYYCIRYVLPKLKLSGDGIIVITASQAALMGIYGYGPYAVTKFALRGLAETIRMESSHKGVSITLALPADTNTPGFENEEKTKPEETKIISSSGGLANPEDVAKQILKDALNGSFFSILGIESWMITILCCGMSPWGGLGLHIIQAILMSPLRIISFFIHMYFSGIVKKCNKKKINK